MTTLSSSPARQLPPVVPLSESEAEEFLSGFDLGAGWSRHTEEQRVTAFKNLSAETQRLLVRNRERGLVCDEFVNGRLDDFCFTLLNEWDESGVFDSLTEAKGIADARLFSSMLVMEHLGSSLDSLGHSAGARYIWAEMVLNEFVESPEDDVYQCAAAYRLSTAQDVAAVAAITTYVAVDEFLHNEELAVHGRDHRDPLVAMVPDIYPRRSEEEGTHCDYLVVNHPELELRLRGRSLADYETALRIVNERNVGTSAEEAEWLVTTVLRLPHPLVGGAL